MVAGEKLISRVANRAWLASPVEHLFGILSNPANKFNAGMLKKFNYTLLFMCHYLYVNKLRCNSLSLNDFVSKIANKYKIKGLC